MAKTLELKRRIRSIGKTRQITRTMEMVSTSKLKRATDRVHAARPYAERLRDVIGRLIDPTLAERYPLLRSPATVRRAAIVLLTSNRGLAGAFNANLIKQARLKLEELRARGIQAELHVAGKKGIAYFRFRGEDMLTQRMDISDAPTVEDAESLVGPIRDRFERGEVDAVYLISSRFVSAMSTPPSTRELLPIRTEGKTSSADVYILSPSGDMILERILPLYIRNAVFTALVENAAAEQGARRSAMKSATDNAGDVLEHLTRTYNRARQAQITQEIAEIVGGSAALE